MRAEPFPSCCAATILVDFNTTDEAVVDAFVKRQIQSNSTMKLLVATTSNGQNWRANHRQNHNNQSVAERVLRANGFRCTRRAYNARHHHPDTGVRLWWRVMGDR